MREARLPVCYRVGRSAVVLDCGGDDSIEAQRRIWHMTREAAKWDGVADVTTGLQNLTLYLDAPHADREYEERLLDAWQRSAGAPMEPEGARIEIHVRYGGAEGPDLTGLALARGLSESDVIEIHCRKEYIVNFIGFLPGFAYLSGLDPSLHTPRKAVPRSRVPAGSVGIGGELTGVYPSASPGGWNLIGRTDRVLFDPRKDPPTLLSPGDRVRFVALT